MALKNKSATNGIKTIILVIIILGVLNITFTSYFDSKINYEETRINLLNKTLNNIYFISETVEQTEKITPDDIKKINLKLKKSEKLFNLFSEGGKFETENNEIKIYPVKNKELLQLSNEISNKFRKITSKIKKYEEEISLYSDKNNITDIPEINILTRKTESLVKKLQKKVKTYKRRKNFTDIFTLILILLSAGYTLLYFKKKIIKDISTINNIITNISKQEEPKQQNELSPEFKEILTDLDIFKKQIKEVSDFINSLLSGNYNVNFSSYGENDIIQNSLLNLRDKLKENIELNKKRQEEEKKRQWFSEGQAKFNDILREATSGIKKLAETSVINMVKFLNAAQGGFFIINDSENKSYLELTAAFAYDRIKMLTKRIEIGEGLIGMCAVEKNTILVTDVPEDYMQIESGLGEAPPKNILIIPLKTEDNILGVIEIASFYNFTPDEVKFMESIAEDIAATLETTKISDKTNELLQETRKKTEELALRDSEMSEKISELRDAQKETKRSESEMNALISVIDKVLFKAELTTAGRISSVNNLFLLKTGYRLAEIRNKSFAEFIKNKDKKTVEDIYKEISKNNFTEKEIIFITSDNREIKTSAFFSAVKNEKNETARILMLADNITYREELKKTNDTLKEELNSKIKIINEKEKELNSLFNKLKNKKENTSPENISAVEKKQTATDRKYADWLNYIKTKKL